MSDQETAKSAPPRAWGWRGGHAQRQPSALSLKLLPVAIFLMLAGIFAYSLQTGDPSKLPSALIGKPVPTFSLPPLEGLKSGAELSPGFATADLTKGEVTIINVWASWCVPCHAEHPLLNELKAKANAPLFGINYKDKPVDARRFLGTLGNPFTAVGVDDKGRAAIDWGVYGVPETFIVDGRGRIAYKHVGPLTPESIDKVILPEIRKARAKG